MKKNLYFEKALVILQAQKRSVTHPNWSGNCYTVFNYCDAIIGFLGMAWECNYREPKVQELYHLVNQVYNAKNWTEVVQRIKIAANYAYVKV